EVYWDAAKSKWLIIWSATVAGKHEGNRLYKSWTPDFRTFTPPEICFDPGYALIDATISQTHGTYYLIFRDERLDPSKKQFKVAEGASPEGPWQNISDGLTESASKDLQHWASVTDRMQLPNAAKHGSFLAITEPEKQRLESAHRWLLPDLYQGET